MKYQRITLRIPEELHKSLMKLASSNSKSMNAEIINRLQSTITQDSKQITIDNIREVIREELSKK